MGLQTANWGVGVRWDVQARNSKGCPLILIGNVSNGPEIELATSSENALHSPYVFYECGENCGETTIKAPKGLYLLDMLAETEGFEPSMRLYTPYSLSRGAPSATRSRFQQC